jgi:hypothetical protein
LRNGKRDVPVNKTISAALAKTQDMLSLWESVLALN